VGSQIVIFGYEIKKMSLN